ncbi:MAG TPA: DUF4232 domain-containing protein, partial [Mycobacterium sp.]|nr:DUF4232 domain-containing protein [Mycobacterium sp.]
VGVDPVNHDQYVFWQNINKNIVESWYPTRHHWWSSPHVMASWPRTAGSPSDAVAGDNQQYVFWQDLGGTVKEGHHTTSWRVYGFPGWKPAQPRSPAATTPYCTAKDLGIHSEKQTGAAGSEYRDFGFVNVTSHACRLYGYPGVSAVTSAGAVLNFQVAHRTSQPERTVILAPGAKASFSLAIRQVTSPCRTIIALRFIPPGDRHYEQIAVRLRACGNRVSVSPVESQPPPI